MKILRINLIFMAIGLSIATTQTFSADWLMLQGTERPNAKHRFWGFVQPAYTRDLSDNLSGLTGGFAVNNGLRTAKNSVAPWFDEDSEFHIRRARFGWRGRVNKKINYFTFFEVAPNLLTFDPFGDRARYIALDHMSLTFNHIKGARIRAGLFKTPGPEESFNAIHTLDYIEFTDFIAREQLERFTTGAARLAGSGSSPSMGTPTNNAYGFSGVRDWGVQIFDRFKGKKWNYSYAVMLGRGEGIHETSDSDGNLDLYLYASTDYNLPGGKGPFKNGVKFYTWYQGGKREFETDTTGTEFDRKRYGFGMKALGKLFGGKYKHRVGFEVLFADGMLFFAPAGGVAEGNLGNGNLQFAAEDGNKSRGVSLDYGFYLNRKWDFGIRYARHDLLHERNANINPGNERIFKEVTLGVNYRFNRKTRLSLNYTFREIEAPNAYTATGGFNATQASVTTSNVSRIVNSTDDRIALQLTWLF